MSQGYITVAYKNKAFLEQALTLSCTIKNTDNTRGIALLTDAALSSEAALYKEKGFFEHVIVLDESDLHGFKPKFAVVKKTPYSRTMYLDSDCLLVQKVEHLWQHMSSQEFCIQGEIKRDGSYSGKDISEWIKELGIDYLPTFNGGCFAWDESGAPILYRTLDILSEPDKYGLPVGKWGYKDDQPAIGIAMAEYNILPLSNALDLHYSFSQGSRLHLDLKQHECRFLKGSYWAEPCVFHYNALWGIDMYKSASRGVLEIEVSKLRKLFGLPEFEWNRPTPRNKLGMMLRGTWRFLDRR